MAESNSDDEDDVVVHEVDICLAKTLAEKLFLFQYPVRPSSMTYDHTPHLAARMKPVQQKVELELGVDFNSNTYCYARGEQIAHSVDQAGGQSNQNSTFEGDLMDRHVLSSVRATENSLKYAAGIYSDGVLHITPVKGVVQLRPSFNYFDKADENQKKAAMANIDKEESQSEEEMDARPVQLRFAGASAQQRNAKGKASSYRQIQQKEAEEPWISMKFFQPQEKKSILQRNLLYCHQDDFESPEFTTTSREYLKILQPQIEADASLPAAMPAGVLSLLHLKKMELKDQIKALLLNAKVVQLSQLIGLLGGGLDEHVIIQGLRQYAMLVQGCWVVKSEILYPKEKHLQTTAIESEKIWPSRDFVMFCFNRKRLLSRKEILSVTKLPPEELREVLEQIARQRSAHGWEFMLPTDVNFLYKYQEVTEEETLKWKERYKELIVELNIPEDQHGLFKDGELPGLCAHAHQKPQSHRRRRLSKSISDENADKKTSTSGKRRSRTISQSSQSQQESDIEMPSVAIKKEKETPKNSPTAKKSNRILSSDSESEKARKDKSSTLSSDSESERAKKDKSSSKKLRSSIKSERTLNGENNIKELKASRDVTKGIMDNSITDDSALKDNANNIKDKSNKQMNTTADSNHVEQHSNHVSEQNNCKFELDPSDVLMEDISVNEVEVSNASSHRSDHDGTESDESVDSRIFIPPAAGGRQGRGDEASDLIKELKRFCRDSLRSGCLSLAEFKEVLELRQQEPGNILSTGVSDELLESCIIETGAKMVSLKWPDVKKIPIDHRRVFLYPNMGEVNDKFRSVIVDMFSGNISLRRKDIIENLKKKIGEQPSNHIYSKVLSEFCENRGGQWYLNGTYKTIQKYCP